MVLFGWALAWFIFDTNLQGLDNYGAISSVIEKYFPIVVGLSLTFVGWSLYNKLRFSGLRDKRRSRGQLGRALSIKEISEASGLRTRDVSQMREAPMMICYFDENSGQIRDVECCVDLDDADMALAVKIKAPDTRAALREAEQTLDDFDDNLPLQSPYSDSGRPPAPRANSEREPYSARPNRLEPLRTIMAEVPKGQMELDLSPREAELIRTELPPARTTVRK